MRFLNTEDKKIRTQVAETIVKYLHTMERTDDRKKLLLKSRK